MKDSISERASASGWRLGRQTKQLTGQAVREVLADRFLINLHGQVTDIYLLIEESTQHATSREQD